MLHLESGREVSQTEKHEKRLFAEEREHLASTSAVTEEEVAEVIALDNKTGACRMVRVVVLGNDDVVSSCP